MLGLTLAACGGGGGGGSSAPPVGTTPVPTQGTERIVISIPRVTTSARTRAPRYISPATQSVKLTAGNVSTTVALTTSNANCVQTATALVCTIDFPVPTGTTTITVSSYASTDGSGTPLSIVTVPVTVVAGQVTILDVTMNAVVSSIRLATASGSPQMTTGTPSTTGLLVTALDAAGKTIAGAGAYTDAAGNPLTIALADSDTSGATSVSPKSFGSPADGNTATLTYNGATIADFTVTASASGLAPAPLTMPVKPGPSNEVVTAPTSFSFLAPGAAYAQTLSVSETGYNGSFTASSGNAAIVTVGPAGPQNTFTVTPVDAGSTTLRVQDAANNVITVPITVSVTGVRLHGKRR